MLVCAQLQTNQTQVSTNIHAVYGFVKVSVNVISNHTYINYENHLLTVLSNFCMSLGKYTVLFMVLCYQFIRMGIKNKLFLFFRLVVVPGGIQKRQMFILIKIILASWVEQI